MISGCNNHLFRALESAGKVSRFTLDLLTQDILVRAFLTVIRQAAQFMSGTDSVMVCVAAQSSDVIAANAASTTRFFMALADYLHTVEYAIPRGIESLWHEAC